MGTTTPNVSGFSQNGADGTFATDTYMGFSFTLGTAAGGLAAGPHTYALTDQPPTVALSSSTTTVANTTPFTVTVTFSEPVTGFNAPASDVTVTNGSVTNITGGPTVYTLTIAPTGAGNITVTVPAGAAQDTALQGNTASAPLAIGNTILGDTQKAIAGFMLGRANNLAANQPGLMHFLQDGGCATFNASASAGAGFADGCTSNGRTWASLTSAWSNGTSYTLGTVGLHGYETENLIIGGMLQFDHATDDLNAAKGTGWMAGPYFVAKLAGQPLYLEGRALYGESTNKIAPLGTFTDAFRTERFLAQLRATGELKLRATTLMPLLDVTYADDTQMAYADSLGNLVPQQTVALTQVTTGLDFSTAMDLQTGGKVTFNGGLSGIYSATKGGTSGFDGGRGRAHLGLTYVTTFGGTLALGAFYDGIGSSYESHGANLSFDMAF